MHDLQGFITRLGSAISKAGFFDQTSGLSLLCLLRD